MSYSLQIEGREREEGNKTKDRRENWVAATLLVQAEPRTTDSTQSTDRCPALNDYSNLTGW